MWVLLSVCSLVPMSLWNSVGIGEGKLGKTEKRLVLEHQDVGASEQKLPNCWILVHSVGVGIVQPKR